MKKIKIYHVTHTALHTISLKNRMCGNVPENIHDGGSLEFPKGRGILKTKIFKVQYEPKLEFPVGSRGLNQKTLCGGVQIFSGTTHKKVLV